MSRNKVLKKSIRLERHCFTSFQVILGPHVCNGIEIVRLELEKPIQS